MQRILVLICVGLLALPLKASEYYTQNPPEITAQFANQPPQGVGVLRQMLLRAYEAAFWSIDGTWNDSQPYAVSLTYFWEIEGKDINDRTIAEMRKVRPEIPESRLAGWRKQLDKAVPGTQDYDRITALYLPPQGAEPARTVFYHQGKKTGVIYGTDFADAFFAIWLDPTTTEPSLRKKLLAE